MTRWYMLPRSFRDSIAATVIRKRTWFSSPTCSGQAIMKMIIDRWMKYNDKAVARVASIVDNVALNQAVKYTWRWGSVVVIGISYLLPSHYIIYFHIPHSVAWMRRRDGRKHLSLHLYILSYIHSYYSQCVLPSVRISSHWLHRGESPWVGKDTTSLLLVSITIDKSMVGVRVRLREHIIYPCK